MADTIYRPLDSAGHEIRLLELLPSPAPTSPSCGPTSDDSSNDNESPIQCNLIHRFLSDAGEYEALSYTWGSPEMTQTILVNGQPMLITKNLEMALRHLCPTGDVSPRILWADALCINQADVAERSHQVTLMKRIYSRCRRDVAWLGPTVEDAVMRKHCHREHRVRQGMELIRRMESRQVEGFIEEYYPMVRQADGTWMDGTADGWLLQGEQTEAVQALLKFSPLFDRVWVMQELACAPEVVLQYADATLPWAVVSRFLGDRPHADAFHLLPAGSHNLIGTVVSKLFAQILAIESQRRIMEEVNQGTTTSTLLDILARFRFAHVTDPRDQIYGLLGLVSEDHDIKVDYRMSAREVFADVTRYLVDSRGNLDILCQSPWMNETVPASPTWAVDIHPIHEKGVEDGEYTRLLFAQRSIFSAGRKNCAVPIPVQDGHVLCLRGSIIGRLGPDLWENYTATNNTPTWISWEQPRELMLCYFQNELLGSPGTRYMNGQPLLEAYWRTIITDCRAYPIRRLTPAEIEDDGKIWDEILRLEKPPEVDIKDYSQLLRPKYKKLASERMWLRNVYGWDFRKSDNGLFLMIRKGAREGDVIGVLDGAKVPVLLREVAQDADGKTKYELINVAYVHGYMDGEAIAQAAEGKLKEQDIFLV